MIELNVNGHTHATNADPDTPLLYVLREDLQLNAAKFGCGLGQCGSCTVLVDGAATLSCVTPILLLEGRLITTLEGLGTPGKPGPLQLAFIEEQAAQCGYCIPGMMMRAQALLQKNPHASEAEIRTQLEPNLCRCGTHMRILRAVRRAASLMQADSATQKPKDNPAQQSNTPGQPGGANSQATPAQPGAGGQAQPSSPDANAAQPQPDTQQPDTLRRPTHSEQRERPER
jgi:nicotinate dehydrogenase subunit A